MNTLLKVIQLYKNEAQLIKKASQNHREAQHMLYQLHASKNVKCVQVLYK